jgi:glucan phosphoethanolaminetransferase (alkaline phosphatase superfamily)
MHIGGGSHGPSYHERYPTEFQKFQPICKDADVVNKCTKEELYNTFDNTILYVDYVVSNIIKTLDKSKVQYVFFYLSDHGESLLEEANARVLPTRCHECAREFAPRGVAIGVDDAAASVAAFAGE